MAHDLEIYDGAPDNPYGKLPVVQPPMNNFGNAFAVAINSRNSRANDNRAEFSATTKVRRSFRVACSRATLAGGCHV